MPRPILPPPATPEEIREARKAACDTFIEQTKQLIALASAFIIAPAVIQAFLTAEQQGKRDVDLRIIIAEALFIASVLAGYVVLATVAGSQDEGSYDVYRPATMWSGRAQILLYIIGLALFGYWLLAR